MKRLITLHSENLFFLFLFALLIIGFLCSSVTAENGPSPLVTPGSVSGLGTMAVVNSPVPVDKGGHGKTTAAEALAALGGASLNGSSTVDFTAKTLTVTPGYGVIKTVSVQLASGAEVNISTLLGSSSANFGRLTVVPNGGTAVFAEFFIQGANNAVQMDDNKDGSITDQASKLCLYPAGGGVYNLKNNLVATYSFIVFYQGRP